MPPMDASDNTSQPSSDRGSTQSDNFNRADLYNGMGSGGRGDMGGMNSGAQGDQNNGIKNDHIDFSQAGDIYGGKGGAQQVGLSGERQNNQNGGQDTQSAPQGNTDRFGRSTEARPDIPQDGVIKPDAPSAGRELNYSQLREGLDRTGPQNEGQVREAAPAAEKPARAPEDSALSTQENGRTSEVSSYSAQDNKLTNYKLNDSGDVSSRTTTDLNNNSVDTVQYGQDGRAVSHQVAENGGQAHDAPLDTHEHVGSIVGQDGKVQAIETSSPEGSSKITLGENGKPASSDKETFGADNSRDTVHTNFNHEGKPYNSESKHYDENGRLQTDERRDPNYTNKTTYDENRNITQTEQTGPISHSITKNTPEGSATATDGWQGHQSMDIRRNDNSAQRTEYDPQTRTSTSNEAFGDGSTRSTTENSASKDTFMKDGTTGAWIKENYNKNTGRTEKQYGVPGMKGAESWSEQAI